MPSKAAYFTAQSEIFSNANRPKTSPHLIFCSIKMAHRGIYIIMTWLLLFRPVASGGLGGACAPHFLVDQLTLSQPGGHIIPTR